MNKLTNFKTQIIKYTLIIALIFEAGSLPVIGFSLEFLCGLAIGVAVSVLSILIMVTMAEQVLASGQKWLSSLGFIIRLPIYGAGFLFCYKIWGIIAGIACLLGFLTGSTAIIYIHGIKAKFSKDRKVRPEVMEEFEREDRDREEGIWKN